MRRFFRQRTFRIPAFFSNFLTETVTAFEKLVCEEEARCFCVMTRLILIIRTGAALDFSVFEDDFSDFFSESDFFLLFFLRFSPFSESLFVFVFFF